MHSGSDGAHGESIAVHSGSNGELLRSILVHGLSDGEVLGYIVNYWSITPMLDSD